MGLDDHGSAGAPGRQDTGAASCPGWWTPIPAAKPAISPSRAAGTPMVACRVVQIRWCGRCADRLCPVRQADAGFRGSIAGGHNRMPQGIRVADRRGVTAAACTVWPEIGTGLLRLVEWWHDDVINLLANPNARNRVFRPGSRTGGAGSASTPHSATSTPRYALAAIPARPAGAGRISRAPYCGALPTDNSPHDPCPKIKPGKRGAAPTAGGAFVLGKGVLAFGAHPVSLGVYRDQPGAWSKQRAASRTDGETMIVQMRNQLRVAQWLMPFSAKPAIRSARTGRRC